MQYIARYNIQYVGRSVALQNSGLRQARSKDLEKGGGAFLKE